MAASYSTSAKEVDSPNEHRNKAFRGAHHKYKCAASWAGSLQHTLRARRGFIALQQSFGPDQDFVINTFQRSHFVVIRAVSSCAKGSHMLACIAVCCAAVLNNMPRVPRQLDFGLLKRGAKRSFSSRSIFRVALDVLAFLDVPARSWIGTVAKSHQQDSRLWRRCVAILSGVLKNLHQEMDHKSLRGHLGLHP